jgi:hypothetical protein
MFETFIEKTLVQQGKPSVPRSGISEAWRASAARREAGKLRQELRGDVIRDGAVARYRFNA